MSVAPPIKTEAEKYPFIIWGGIGFAVLIFVVLYVVSIRKIKKDTEKAEGPN